METYLVGGAVRDRLLGREVRERDWVVVGGSADEMLAAGYRQVGRDFPVFLHPETGEEYALARTERKTGPGHTGFAVHADPTVTLEEDLSRRDLTVNAMAEDAAGGIIDPFGGREDLEARLLRHVSDAFVEDPLRVFRVARFAARMPGFQVHGETLGLMREMAARNALAELSAERVWVELTKALDSPAPNRFFEVLAEASAGAPWFAELVGQPLPDLTVLEAVDQRFALAVGDLAADAAERLAERLKTPRAVWQAALWLIECGALLAGWRGADAADVYRGLRLAGAFKPDNDLARRLALVGAKFPAADDVEALLALSERVREHVTAGAYQQQGLGGAQLGRALEAGRIEAVRAGQAQA